MATTKVYGSQIKEQTVQTEVFENNSINGSILINSSITPEKLQEKYSLYGHTHEGFEMTSQVASAKNADFVEWSGVLNKPNFADASWKGVKANKSVVSLTGNSIGDTIVVIDDGDGKGSLYVCKATTGAFEQQWGKEGDVDWSSPDWASIINKPSTVDGYKITDASKVGHTHTKANITDFPTTMTPSAHKHVGSDITTAVPTAINATMADNVKAQPFIFSATAPADTTKLWIDSNGIGYFHNGTTWVSIKGTYMA
jgi:hypothetical protein